MTPQNSSIGTELDLDLDKGGFEEEENMDEERWEAPRFKIIDNKYLFWRN